MNDIVFYKKKLKIYNIFTLINVLVCVLLFMFILGFDGLLNDISLIAFFVFLPLFFVSNSKRRYYFKIINYVSLQNLTNKQEIEIKNNNK